MRKICLIMSLLILLSGLASAENGKNGTTVSTEKIIRAIVRLEADPLQANARGFLTLISDFANKSPDVFVELNSGYFPWLKQEKKIARTDILLVAFIGGNIRPQLETGKKQDHPVEGMQSMLAVYTKLRQVQQIERILKLDQWNILDRKGLEKLLSRIKEKDSEQTPPGSMIHSSEESI